MSKRKQIIQVLQQIKPITIDHKRPTSVFIGGKAGEDYRNLNITDLSVDKDYVIVTIGRFLFKRKYRIKKDEI